MIVCSCLRVSDREVRAAIRRGAGSVEALGEACGAGSRCGTCQPALCELLRERQDLSPRNPMNWLRARPGPTGV
jgi:bacterioferritin-associated ferredoxin